MIYVKEIHTLDCHKVVFVALTALTVAFSITQEEDLHGESRISLVIANFAWWHLLYTVLNSGCGKVHRSVSHSVHRWAEEGVWSDTPSGRHPLGRYPLPWADTPPLDIHPPPGRHPLPLGRHPLPWADTP